MGRITNWLNNLYRFCGYLAGLCIAMMLIIIVAQVVMRWSGASFPGAASYAGYLMGTSTFFALAYTFNAGGHIRVELLIDRAGRFRPVLEVWTLAVATAISGFISWYAVDAVYWSYRFGEVSSSQDATPLWVPQVFLALGSLVFTLCLIDNLCRTGIALLRTASSNERQPARSP